MESNTRHTKYLAAFLTEGFIQEEYGGLSTLSQLRSATSGLENVQLSGHRPENIAAIACAALDPSCIATRAWDCDTCVTRVNDLLDVATGDAQLAVIVAYLKGDAFCKDASVSPDAEACAAYIDALAPCAIQALVDLKLLLLGAGECGKSTFLKQIRILHNQGYSTTERHDFAYTIRINAASNLLALIEAMKKFNLGFSEKPARVADVSLLQTYEDIISTEDANDYALIKLGGAMTRLWSDKSVMAVYAMRQILSMSDSAGYILDRLPTIFNPFFVPTDQDIIHCRVQTTGVVSIQFNYSGLTFEVLDVGGQRSERKKWIHCFENVYAVLFVAALSDYDLTMAEDPEKNRMEDSLALFDQICNNRWFEECSIILFLNKKDIFREKIKKIPISNYFPKYTGKQAYEDASTFIRLQFEEMNRSDKDVFSHFTCATDSHSVKFIFDAVMTNLIMNNLKSVGLQ
eukprot:snap_masked-scaffold300_size216557-processed-gene-1.25 protein:Tk07150 transcript:snap_masked-scaffold300_size216557-processed-gene-1.25-mRNA-1 annotation:"guanine nucleotide-binding protein g subunit alpha"